MTEQALVPKPDWIAMCLALTASNGVMIADGINDINLRTRPNGPNPLTAEELDLGLPARSLSAFAMHTALR